jgi:hypothetical protein
MIVTSYRRSDAWRSAQTGDQPRVDPLDGICLVPRDGVLATLLPPRIPTPSLEVHLRCARASSTTARAVQMSTKLSLRCSGQPDR